MSLMIEGYVAFEILKDFGPLDLGNTYTFCLEINKLLSNIGSTGKPVVYYCSDNPHHRSNSTVLLAAYQIWVLKRTPQEVYRPFIGIKPTFIPYRDAVFSANTFPSTVLDCVRALARAASPTLQHFSFESFALKSYQDLKKLQNGDISWIIPNKLIAFSGPVNKRREIEPGVFTLLPKEYIPIFKSLGVTCIIRFNSKCYDRYIYTAAGIRHVDLYYEDGANPSEAILQSFLQVCETEKGAIAVHCKAGLGRTGTNIAAYMIKHYGYSAREAIAWCRLCRPGCIVGPQQQYLIVNEDKLRIEGELYYKQIEEQKQRYQQSIQQQQQLLLQHKSLHQHKSTATTSVLTNDSTASASNPTSNSAIRSGFPSHHRLTSSHSSAVKALSAGKNAINNQNGANDIAWQSGNEATTVNNLPSPESRKSSLFFQQHNPNSNIMSASTNTVSSINTLVSAATTQESISNVAVNNYSFSDTDSFLNSAGDVVAFNSLGASENSCDLSMNDSTSLIGIVKATHHTTSASNNFISNVIPAMTSMGVKTSMKSGKDANDTSSKDATSPRSSSPIEIFRQVLSRNTAGATNESNTISPRPSGTPRSTVTPRSVNISNHSVTSPRESTGTSTVHETATALKTNGLRNISVDDADNHGNDINTNFSGSVSAPSSTKNTLKVMINSSSTESAVSSNPCSPVGNNVNSFSDSSGSNFVTPSKISHNGDESSNGTVSAASSLLGMLSFGKKKSNPAGAKLSSMQTPRAVILPALNINALVSSVTPSVSCSDTPTTKTPSGGNVNSMTSVSNSGLFSLESTGASSSHGGFSSNGGVSGLINSRPTRKQVSDKDRDISRPTSSSNNNNISSILLNMSSIASSRSSTPDSGRQHSDYLSKTSKSNSRANSRASNIIQSAAHSVHLDPLSNIPKSRSGSVSSRGRKLSKDLIANKSLMSSTLNSLGHEAVPIIS